MVITCQWNSIQTIRIHQQYKVDKKAKTNKPNS